MREPVPTTEWYRSWMRTQALSTCFVLAALSLAGLEARADLLPPNHKGIKLSVRVEVEAEMPAGKALVLANTFQGADLITPGQLAEVDWHPLGGEMQLRLLNADMLTKLGPLREALDRDAITQLISPGPPCGAPFQGVRTISDSSTAAEVRWTLKVTTEGDACAATLLRMDYLNAEGAQVPTPDGAPPGTPITPAGEPTSPGDLTAPGDAVPAPAPAKDAAPTPSQADPAPPASDKAAGCGCASTGGAPLGLGLVGLVFGAAIRLRLATKHR